MMSETLLHDPLATNFIRKLGSTCRSLFPACYSLIDLTFGSLGDPPGPCVSCKVPDFQSRIPDPLHKGQAPSSLLLMLGRLQLLLIHCMGAALSSLTIRHLQDPLAMTRTGVHQTNSEKRITRVEQARLGLDAGLPGQR